MALAWLPMCSLSRQHLSLLLLIGFSIAEADDSSRQEEGGTSSYLLRREARQHLHSVGGSQATSLESIVPTWQGEQEDGGLAVRVKGAHDGHRYFQVAPDALEPAPWSLADAILKTRLWQRSRRPKRSRSLARARNESNSTTGRRNSNDSVPEIAGSDGSASGSSTSARDASSSSAVIVSDAVSTDFNSSENASNADRIAEDARLQPMLYSGLFKLPPQPECQLLADYTAGQSDLGSGQHECKTCIHGCTKENRQPPMRTSWRFQPALATAPAFDIAMAVEFRNIRQVAEYPLNGISYKIEFVISRSGGAGFLGSMGPEARGGVAAGALNGKHYLEIRDTAMPSPDGSVVHGRRLVLPSKRRSGQLGSCKRACLGCEDFPQVKGVGMSSGVVCSFEEGVDNGESFVYRLRLLGAAVVSRAK
eukprot:TRINITY_DN32762_c0_g1_i3.p1 TRINITY_DN32762_c0_g1~~TRINITY_DN32762_c0_g1_i3.p1  ORF type:complete len:421 (+),score=42.82 TRINITY_DN32762_c0_g1_i3:108-1370(+)